VIQSDQVRTEDLLRQMTLKEKVTLLSGKDNWRTVPVPRLNIPSITMTDGPHGVRATNEAGRTFEPTTSFPTGVSMAASWNPGLIERVAVALAEETRAMGCDVLLGPCVNIVRHPTAGRNFESFSEDPYLAARIGIAWVQGLQSKGISAALKHFACNNQETERWRGSSEVDERTLREIYLAQFEAIVKDANPWMVMCSYNRINGVYASQNPTLLKSILKTEWNWDGVVVSDWGANHTIVESVQGGLDLEMPGPAKYYGLLLEEAVLNWQIDPTDIDEAAKRVLGLIDRISSHHNPPDGAVNTQEHQALARELAEESITLLKNDSGLLPLNASKINTLAVIGPMADTGSIGGGGSSFVQPPYRVSPLEGLRALVGDSVELSYEEGCDNYFDLPLIRSDMLATPDGKGGGLRGHYFDNPDFAGVPVLDRVDPHLDFWFLTFAPLEATPSAYSVRWTGELIAPRTGRFTLRVVGTGRCRVELDGTSVIDLESSSFDPPGRLSSSDVELLLEEGKRYELKIEFVRPEWLNIPTLYLSMGYTPRPEEDQRLSRAVELAKQADAAIVFAGWPEGYESEGRDRPGIGLTGKQDDLIAAVAQANPNTIVVLNCGSPVAMPWVDAVPAIVEAYYPGQEGGHAVSAVLFGEVNPSGKLTVTFPKQIEDTPAFHHFPGGRNVYYGEGIFVGYRHYDARNIEPLFPFGHGLSYTEFEYSDLIVPAETTIGDPLTVRFAVKNIGERAGKEVAQLYVSDLVSSLPRPRKELKGFAKIELQPGETQEVTILLDERAFAFYDPDQQRWIVEPGEFEILLGASSQDIRLKGCITLA